MSKFSQVVLNIYLNGSLNISGVHLGNYSIHGAFLAFLVRSLDKQNPVPPPECSNVNKKLLCNNRDYIQLEKRNKRHIYHMTIVYTIPKHSTSMVFIYLHFTFPKLPFSL